MKINRPLAISMVLNLGLLGLIGSMLAGKTKPVEPPVSGVRAEFDRETAPAPVAAALHWSQVESADYTTYVANLRAIGCPEQTVRNIVTTELIEVFARERNELQTPSAPAGIPGPTPTSTQKLQDLEREQQGFLASLLASSATSRSASAAETGVLPSARDLLAQGAGYRTAGPVLENHPAATVADAGALPQPPSPEPGQSQRPNGIASQPTNALSANPPRQRPARRDLFTVEEQRYRALWGWGGFYYEPATGQ